MNDHQADQALTAIRESWPYQGIPDRLERHWRTVLAAWEPSIVRKVLDDCGSTMKSRPHPGEFYELCGQLHRVAGRHERQRETADLDAAYEPSSRASEHVQSIRQQHPELRKARR